MHSKKQTLIFIALLFFLSFPLRSQDILYQVTNLEVLKNNGKALPNALAGGLNNPQFSSVNFDSTGFDDLFVFDRTGDKILTFINDGTPGKVSYKYAPQHEILFPKIKNWALIRDFNLDGVGDLVAHDNLGMRAFSGSFQNGFLKFQLETSLVSYEYINAGDTNYLNIWVAKDDIPGVVDVDKDGDLDILAFGLFGNAVEYYRNRSLEMFGSGGFKSFVQEEPCWGQFQEASLTNSVILGPCKGGSSIATGNVRHAGSTICTPDFHNDGDVDLILGDISFPNLVALENQGDSSFALVGNVDTSFPNYDVPANLPIYPGAFSLDVDNDGKEDIISSPNSKSASVTQSNVWYYKNQSVGGNSDYQFVTDSFLINTMIDLGENSSVTFFNYNNDSLMDIIVSSYGYYQIGGNAPAQLMLLENTGSRKEPVFEIVTGNYSNLKQLNLFSIHPAFGDLDADGDQDMIIGEETGILHFFKNTAGPNDPANLLLAGTNYMSIDVGQFSTPLLYDLNGDTLLDLIIGDKSGVLQYYQNVGDEFIPQYDITAYNSNLGNVDVTDPTSIDGHSDPYIIEDTMGNPVLYVGSSSGRIFKYEINSDSLLSGSFNLVSDFIGNIDVGSLSSVSVYDLNNDGNLEFLTGNGRGGISLYSESIWDSAVVVPPIDTSDTTIIGIVNPIDDIKIFPNPSNGYFTISSTEPLQRIVVYNTIGVRVEEISLSAGVKEYLLDISNHAKGVYFLQLSVGNDVVGSRILVK